MVLFFESLFFRCAFLENAFSEESNRSINRIIKKQGIFKKAS